MLRVLWGKELLELWRTRRLLIMLLVLGAFGLLSPLLARLTPILVERFVASQEGVQVSMPAPTLVDAMAQYIKNVTQFGVLLVVLLGLGAVAGEKERGTAVLLLSRPVRRGTVLWAKLLAQLVTLLVSLLLAAGGCYVYSAILFEAPPLGALVQITGLVACYILVYLSMTLLASTLASSVAVAAGWACGGLLLLVGSGSLPGLGTSTHGGLLVWAGELARGSSTGRPAALAVSLVLIVGFLFVAQLRFTREELG
jgi:ABC-2 type transport system permease protein